MHELGRPSPDEYAGLKKHPIVLLLEDIRSLHNVGSIFRTADAFAIQGLALCGFTGAPPRREIHAAALGAEMSVPWKYYETAPDAISNFKKRGFRIIALEQCQGSQFIGTHAPELNDITTPEEEKTGNTPPGRLILLGNEVRGVSEQALALADECIEIPQYGTKHSLNVAVAAGIILWDFLNGKPPKQD